MRILLDTCTVIWLCAEPARLSAAAVAAVEETDAELFFSDVSALEIVLKWSAGELDLPLPPRQWIEKQIKAWSMGTLPISRKDIYRAGDLPDHHRDPFDRLLVATALNHDATLLTPDPALRAYPVGCRW